MVFDEKYCVRWHDGKISYHTLNELMTVPKYRRLERFGMVSCPVLRPTLEQGVEFGRYGRIVHKDVTYKFRYQVFVEPDSIWNRFGYYVTKHFAVYEGVIYDGLDRPMDPRAIVAAYDALHTHKTKESKSRGRWNSRDYGAKRSPYGHRKNRRVRRNMEIYLLAKHTDRSIEPSFVDLSAELDHIHPFEQTTADEIWSHVREPKVRQTGVINSFYRFEAYWDCKPRDVMKSWKYQNKRNNQWKA